MNRNLLILGAGQYSFVVKEIAEAMKIFDKIDMLDDCSAVAIDKIENYEKYLDAYTYAVVSIGNNKKRLELIHKLRKAGYMTPAMVHPCAYVSPSANIGDASIIEPFAVVQANATVGKGCILSATSVVNHNAVIEDGAHCDCGTVTAARGVVPSCHKVQCGAVFYAAVPDDGDIEIHEAYNADVGI